MNKIKLMMPLWLVVLYVGSIVFMIQSRRENSLDYQLLVRKARECAGNDMVVDAIDYYEEALVLDPDIDLAVEAGEVYLEREEYYDARSWYTARIHTVYPNEPKTYDFGIRLSLAQDNYREAFAVYHEYKERNLFSESIESLMDSVMYTFDLSGQFEECQPFGNLSGIAAVRIQDYWGYINTKGERILDFVYTSAGMFSDLGAVTDQEGEAYFTDSAGNKRITEKAILNRDPELGKVERFLGIESDRMWAYNGEIWNCYDAQTCEKLFGGYRDATVFTNGVGGVMDEGGKWALIDTDGSLITDFLYDDVLTDQKGYPCRTEAVLALKDGNYLLLNRTGERVGDQFYEDACAFFDTTYAAVRTDGEWVFIDEKGTVQDLGVYEQAESFSAGLAAVCQGGKWGYIDLQGELVIDYQFSEAGPFSSSGIAFVKTEDGEYWEMLTLYKDNFES